MAATSDGEWLDPEDPDVKELIEYIATRSLGPCEALGYSTSHWWLKCEDKKLERVDVKKVLKQSKRTAGKKLKSSVAETKGEPFAVRQTSLTRRLTHSHTPDLCCSLCAVVGGSRQHAADCWHQGEAGDAREQEEGGQGGG